jgi:hypothetical protein
VNEDVARRMHVTGVAVDIATVTQSTAVIGVAAPEAVCSGQGWVPCVQCRCRRATPVHPVPVAAPPVAQLLCPFEWTLVLLSLLLRACRSCRPAVPGRPRVS